MRSKSVAACRNDGRARRASGHHCRVSTEPELRSAVDGAFARLGREFEPWPDPHPDRVVLDEEYSRLLDPAKWKIIGARADAWIVALIAAGLAAVRPNPSISWRRAPGSTIARTDLVVPHAAGALPLVVARSRLGAVDDAGVVLGVGDPALCVGWFPDCGCDACDSGSQDELGRLDAHVLGIVAGHFRRLSDGGREIMSLGGGGWSASGTFGRGEVDAVLEDPTGWDELTGASWFPGRRGRR